MLAIISPWLAITFVLITLVSLIVGLRWYKRRFSPHPELVRKLLHTSMGLTTLSFPWLFDEVWPILVLAGVTIPGLLVLRRAGRLKTQFGDVICGVERPTSLGEIYFPIGVAALFILAGGDLIRYTIPILLLALADAIAALIGIRYGRLRYSTVEGTKSAEGSIAFLLAAFLSVYLSLLFFQATGPAETILIAFILSLLLMMVEAVAWHGLDNLFIPIVGFFLLDNFLSLSAAELTNQLIITLAVTVFVMLWRRYANLHDSALLGAALIGYFVWTLADWRWFSGLLIVFVAHLGLTWFSSERAQLLEREEPVAAQAYSIFSVLGVASSGLLWLFLFRLFNQANLFYPFTLALAVQLAILVIVSIRQTTLNLSGGSLLSLSSLAGWLLLFIPFVLLEGMSGEVLKYAAAALPAIGLAGLVFYQTQPFSGIYPANWARWLRQGGCGLLGSLLGLMVM